MMTIEVVAQTCSVKKVYLEISQNSQENICARVSFLIKLACNFIKKETLAQVFSCEFCEISKNTIFTEHLWTNASGVSGLSTTLSVLTSLLFDTKAFFNLKKKQ